MRFLVVVVVWLASVGIVKGLNLKMEGQKTDMQILQEFLLREPSVDVEPAGPVVQWQHSAAGPSAVGDKRPASHAELKPDAPKVKKARVRKQNSLDLKVQAWPNGQFGPKKRCIELSVDYTFAWPAEYTRRWPTVSLTIESTDQRYSSTFPLLPGLTDSLKIEMHKKLGSGTFGVVHPAETRDGKFRAVKCVSTDNEDTRKTQDRVCDIWKKLSEVDAHPNVLPLLRSYAKIRLQNVKIAPKSSIFFQNRKICIIRYSDTLYKNL